MTEEANVPQQRYVWTKKKVFDTFNEADTLRKKLKAEGSLTKVRRCGPGGTKFKVLTGSEIKTKKQSKGEKDATE